MWLNYNKALSALKFDNDRNILRKANAYLRRVGVLPKSPEKI